MDYADLCLSLLRPPGTYRRLPGPWNIIRYDDNIALLGFNNSYHLVTYKEYLPFIRKSRKKVVYSSSGSKYLEEAKEKFTPWQKRASLRVYPLAEIRTYSASVDGTYGLVPRTASKNPKYEYIVLLCPIEKQILYGLNLKVFRSSFLYDKNTAIMADPHTMIHPLVIHSSGKAVAACAPFRLYCGEILDIKRAKEVASEWSSMWDDDIYTLLEEI